MKKAAFYYLLIVTAAIGAFAMGLIREVFFKSYRIEYLSITLAFFLLITALVFIRNIRKIKFSSENFHFLENTLPLKISSIVLASISLFLVGGQLLSTLILSITNPRVRTSPFMYLFTVLFIIYLFFLVKLIIEIFKYEPNNKKQNNPENSQLDVNKIDVNHYPFSGHLSTPYFDHRSLAINSEFNIDKKTYSNYRPILNSKKFNNKGDCLLNFSNKDDLNFSVFVKENTKVFIRINNRSKNKDIIYKEIFNTIKTFS